MVSQTGKISGRARGWRVVLGAIALGSVVAGLAGVPAARADGWGGEHRDRDDYRDNDWRRDREREAWRRHEWREHQAYGGYYAAPQVYYPVQPYYPVRPYGYYYPGSLNVVIPIR